MTANRVRMTGQERREQLIGVGRKVFAERGFEAASVEEIADRAGVSKPVVYEHFGGKDGLYAVVVDLEVHRLLDALVHALSDAPHPRAAVERSVDVFLEYIDKHRDGFRILVRDAPVGTSAGTLPSLLNDVADQAQSILAAEFEARDLDPKLAPLYARALVGMVALVGEWWLETGKPEPSEVAAHLVNLAWNGLQGLDPDPLRSSRRRTRGA